MKVSDAANYSDSVLPVTIVVLLFYALVIPLTLLMLRRIFDKMPLKKELRKYRANLYN